MAEEYLAQREELALCVQLVDSRHAPTALDRQLYEWLVFHGKDFIVAATKADKLSSNKLNQSLKEIGKALPESKIIAYSSLTGRGKDELWQEIGNALKKA